MRCHAHRRRPAKTGSGNRNRSSRLGIFPAASLAFPPLLVFDAIVAPKLICIILQSQVEFEGGSVAESQARQTYSHGFPSPGGIQMKFGGTKK